MIRKEQSPLTTELARKLENVVISRRITRAYKDRGQDVKIEGNVLATHDVFLAGMMKVQNHLEDELTNQGKGELAHAIIDKAQSMNIDDLLR